MIYIKAWEQNHSWKELTFADKTDGEDSLENKDT